MNVEEFAKKFGYDTICMPDPDRIIDGGYAGDLLSWVMGRLDADNAWVTIMSNINIVAVAALADPSCIILAEGVSPDEGVIEKAISQEVNILRSAKNTFEICADLKSVL
jgi:hypothetical protein